MNSYNAKEKSNLPKKVDKAKCKPFVEWYKKEITADCFEIRKGKDNLYYAHHKDWKKTVWIGPYDSEDEVKKVRSDSHGNDEGQDELYSKILDEYYNDHVKLVCGMAAGEDEVQKVLWSKIRLSLAPTLVKMRSTRGIFAAFAGTNEPICAITVIKATCRI